MYLKYLFLILFLIFAQYCNELQVKSGVYCDYDKSIDNEQCLVIEKQKMSFMDGDEATYFQEFSIKKNPAILIQKIRSYNEDLGNKNYIEKIISDYSLLLKRKDDYCYLVNTKKNILLHANCKDGSIYALKFIYNPKKKYVFNYFKNIERMSRKEIETLPDRKVPLNKLLLPKSIENTFYFELKILRNSIFAQYGYKFKTKWLNDYFNSRSWYQEKSNFTTEMLTKIDKKNIDLIKKAEEIIKKASNYTRLVEWEVLYNSALAEEYSQSRLLKSKKDFYGYLETYDGAAASEKAYLCPSSIYFEPSSYSVDFQIGKWSYNNGEIIAKNIQTCEYKCQGKIIVASGEFCEGEWRFIGCKSHKGEKSIIINRELIEYWNNAKRNICDYGEDNDCIEISGHHRVELVKIKKFPQECNKRYKIPRIIKD